MILTVFCDFLFRINLKKTRKLYKKRKVFLQNPLQFLFDCVIICPYVAQRRNDVKEHQNYEMRYTSMKEGIHPKYEKCIIKCACGETVESKSTKGGEIKVEICSKCHPFFTGKQKFVDAGGRVDKFKKRIAAFQK